MSKKMKLTGFRSLWLPISSLTPHPKVQRIFDKEHADRIANSFDPDAFRELYVTPAGSSKYHVWDGQHRLAAAKVVLGMDQLLPCRIYEDVPQDRLAQIQVTITTGNKAWKAVDMFRQKILARDKAALEIENILKSFGLTILPQKQNGAINAVKAIEAIYLEDGPNTLKTVLAILHDAWKQDSDAYSAVILRGLTTLLEKHPNLDGATMSMKLARSFTPADLIARARTKHKNDMVSTSSAVSSILLNAYNARKKRKVEAA